MAADLVSNLLDFLKEEKIKMNLEKTSDSDFWIESPDGFMTVRFVVDTDSREIIYDIFSPKYDVHLKEETLSDVETLDLIVEETGKWEYEKTIENLWLILDWIKLWAQNTRFRVKEMRLI